MKAPKKFSLIAVFSMIALLMAVLAVTVLIPRASTSNSFLDRLFEHQVIDQFQSYATKITGKQSLYVARLEQMEI
ncbi:MAG: hypothetical protein AAGB31_13195 [Bdellovibrio sp.]